MIRSRTPVSPWSVYVATSPSATPVVIFVLAAATAAYLASAGAILAKGRLFSVERKVKTLKDVKDAYNEALAAIDKRTKTAIEVSRGGRPAALVLDYAEDTEKEDY